MNLQEATDLLIKTMKEIGDAQERQKEAEATIEGSRLIVQGIFKRYPELVEEVQWAGVDEELDETAPRGGEAVLRVLQTYENRMFSVAEMVNALSERGWVPDSDDPANAVRTALERLRAAKTPGLKKIRKEGKVLYRYNEPEPEPPTRTPPALAYDPMATIVSGGPH